MDPGVGAWGQFACMTYITQSEGAMVSSSYSKKYLVYLINLITKLKLLTVTVSMTLKSRWRINNNLCPNFFPAINWYWIVAWTFIGRICSPP